MYQKTSRALQIQKYQQIKQMVDAGGGVKESCTKVGIKNIGNYYYWLKSNQPKTVTVIEHKTKKAPKTILRKSPIMFSAEQVAVLLRAVSGA